MGGAFFQQKFMKIGINSSSWLFFKEEFIVWIKRVKHY
jgi:hypothetical protein